MNQQAKAKLTEARREIENRIERMTWEMGVAAKNGEIERYDQLVQDVLRAEKDLELIDEQMVGT